MRLSHEVDEVDEVTSHWHCMKGAKYYVMLHALGCGCFLLRGIGSKLEGVSNVVNLCNQ